MHKKISKEVDKIRNKYCDSAEEIVGGYNRELSLSKDYEGRQMFELLQNADDEAYGSNGKVLITFDGTTLSVSNTGNPFSFQGVKSLLYPNASPKKIHAEKIGSKGLGFRSILTWASSVTIASQEFAIQFSKEYAANFLSSIITTNPSLTTEIKNLSPDENPIATLTCPKILKENPLIDGYATSIIIECKKELSKKIEKQIMELQLEELVFLPNLKNIEIICNNYHKSFLKTEDHNKVTIDTVDFVENETETATWDVFKETGTIECENEGRKAYEFIIAYDPTGAHVGEVLYSYFRTDVELGFPALIHGTFELTSDRNNLQKESNVNKQLIELLADFMIATAVKISENQSTCDYRPLKLIISSEMNFVLKNDYHFNDKLREKVYEKAIFPSISGKYISVHDQPKYSSFRFDKYLNSKFFPSLLIGTSDSEIEDYIQKDLGIEFYPYDAFCTQINADIPFYTTEKKVELIKLVNSQYLYSKHMEIFPHLLEDVEGKPIEDRSTVFVLPHEEEILNLPEWVKVKFLSHRMEKMLLLALNIGNSRRNLSSLLSIYNLEEYSFDKLLRGVINKEGQKINSKKKCKDILKWLWGYYHTIQNQNLNEIKIKVICRDGKIRFANECYIGTEFGNDLGERLIEKFSNNFVSPDSLKGNRTDLKSQIDFFEWIGASKFPKFNIETLEGPKKYDYLKCHESFYSLQDNCNYKYSEFRNFNAVNVGTYEQLENLLIESDFNDLLSWLVVDEGLNTRINSDYEEENRNIFIEGYPGQKRDPRRITSNYMNSYLMFIVKNIEWIPGKNGEKKRPQYCCLEENYLNPLVIVPTINYPEINRVVGRSCKKEVDALLSRIGVCDVFQEMEPTVIYQTLLELPNLDTDHKKGERLYRKLIKDGLSPEELQRNNPAYKEFISKGLVLTKCGDTKRYAPISQARYADKKTLSKEILKNFNILEVDSRSGEEKVKKLFGVESLKNLEVSIDGIPSIHKLNDDFEREYSQFLPYVYATRMDLKNSKADLIKLQSTKVILCDFIKLRYNINDEIHTSILDSFETLYLRTKDTAYIQVPPSEMHFETLKQTVEFADAVAEIITSSIDINGEKELFRDLFRDATSDRKAKMRIDNGDNYLELLELAKNKFNEKIDKRKEFWTTVAKIKDITYSEESTFEEIISLLNIKKSLTRNIDYDSLSSFENCPKVIAIFKQLGIDIPDFNKLSQETIDIRSFWQKSFCEKKRTYFNKYKAYLFAQLKTKKDNVEQFDQLCENFDICVADCPNSINVNIDDLFKQEFGVSLNKLRVYSGDETNEIFQQNLKSIDKNTLKKIKSLFPESMIQASILFDRFEELLKAPITKELTVAEDHEGSLSDLVTQVLSAETIGFSHIDIQAEKYHKTAKHSPKKRKPIKKIHSEFADHQKSKIGMIGEAVVYKELKKLHSSARWVSGNSEKAGITRKGDDTCGYDMYYTDENATVQYVEVKASKNDEISFIMSDGELRFACDHASNYEVIFVQIGEDNLPARKPWRLGHLFDFSHGESLFNNRSFTIEGREYNIRVANASEE